jgi:AcrR family transcriptional regulator
VGLTARCYEATTTTDIAERAGVSGRSVRLCFPARRGRKTKAAGPGGRVDRVRQFPIALGSVEFADIRNTDQGHACAACGHVNDPIPTALWGWEREAAQIRAVNAAHRELAQAAPSPAASSATGTGAKR